MYVPCGIEEAYTTSNWGGFSNFVGLCAGEITVTADPAEGGTATGGGSYEGGVICTLTATSTAGYSFINWTKDGVGVSNTETYSFYVTGDASYVAHFVQGTTITFADANVKALCVANWDTDGDGELSYAEAAAVTNLGMVFKSNSNINSFDELQYFVGLTSIGYDTFFKCSGLTSIVIPNSVTSIGSSAFGFCSGLTSIVIPNSVTSIGNSAFFSCRGLTYVEIPNSVTSIGSSAFYSCSGLTFIEIPNSVISIGTLAFNGCSKLEQIIVASGNTVYDSRGNCNAIIETSTNILELGCMNTIIPNSVTSIGSSAFSSCSGLISIEIPNSVTSIGSSAFYSCSSLASVIMLSSSVPSLGNNAFSGTNANYYIYVPYPSLEAYKTATNWSNYEHRIFPMAYASVSGYGTGNGRWVFIASPFSDDVVPSAIDNMLLGTNYDLYQFDQSATDEEWQNYKDDSFNLVNGHGYMYANGVDVNVIFKGAFNEDETKVVSLDYDAEKTNPGWNLVGNPFPVDAYIDRPYYVMNEDGTAINPIAVPADTPIPPCVGVLVKANGTGESVTFSRSAPETRK